MPPSAPLPPAPAAFGYDRRVLPKILGALLVVQLLDLMFLVVLSREFGFWQTVAVLLLVGMVGSALARREGGRVWRGFQASVAEGRPPEHGVVDGVLVLLGGVLLLLPGILSDVVGLALFVPPLRRAIAARVRQRLGSELAARPPISAGVRRFGREPPERDAPISAPAVIDTTGVESRE
jgi:UPF0716 protein FxsA